MTSSPQFITAIPGQDSFGTAQSALSPGSWLSSSPIIWDNILDRFQPNFSIPDPQIPKSQWSLVANPVASRNASSTLSATFFYLLAAQTISDIPSQIVTYLKVVGFSLPTTSTAGPALVLDYDIPGNYHIDFSSSPALAFASRRPFLGVLSGGQVVVSWLGSQGSNGLAQLPSNIFMLALYSSAGSNWTATTPISQTPCLSSAIFQPQLSYSQKYLYAFAVSGSQYSCLLRTQFAAGSLNQTCATSFVTPIDSFYLGSQYGEPVEPEDQQVVYYTGPSSVYQSTYGLTDQMSAVSLASLPRYSQIQSTYWSSVVFTSSPDGSYQSFNALEPIDPTRSVPWTSLWSNSPFSNGSASSASSLSGRFKIVGSDQKRGWVYACVGNDTVSGLVPQGTLVAYSNSTGSPIPLTLSGSTSSNISCVDSSIVVFRDKTVLSASPSQVALYAISDAGVATSQWSRSFATQSTPVVKNTSPGGNDVFVAPVLLDVGLLAIGTTIIQSSSLVVVPSPPSPDPSTSAGLSAGAITGIILGACVVLALIAFLLIRRARAKLASPLLGTGSVNRGTATSSPENFVNIPFPDNSVRDSLALAERRANSRASEALSLRDLAASKPASREPYLLESQPAPRAAPHANNSTLDRTEDEPYFSKFRDSSATVIGLPRGIAGPSLDTVEDHESYHSANADAPGIESRSEVVSLSIRATPPRERPNSKDGEKKDSLESVVPPGSDRFAPPAQQPDTRFAQPESRQQRSELYYPRAEPQLDRSDSTFGRPGSQFDRPSSQFGQADTELDRPETQLSAYSLASEGIRTKGGRPGPIRMLSMTSQDGYFASQSESEMFFTPDSLPRSTLSRSERHPSAHKEADRESEVSRRVSYTSDVSVESMESFSTIKAGKSTVGSSRAPEAEIDLAAYFGTAAPTSALASFHKPPGSSYTPPTPSTRLNNWKDSGSHPSVMARTGSGASAEQAAAPIHQLLSQATTRSEYTTADELPETPLERAGTPSTIVGRRSSTQSDLEFVDATQGSLTTIPMSQPAIESFSDADYMTADEGQDATQRAFPSLSLSQAHSFLSDAATIRRNR
ncbi:uncharacterized protein BJ171DRAFT_509888 [Polychytrium aggregatum]|uniref:uncharacterized protein n=1 Tax=Polychytrium aggregatum TaxID=110093 RepID=UPI0022FDB615|nr:uncharacterized protein BJ171DRAFT_509888 [Polychytrium aggregatum]KAI9203529.1 hypothetical protein BJ171DRAFT_509888 [Polychytrium aggregatum]